ncbi:MAG TPA: hypothetical protein VMM76_27825, partial [Pirellulaceae bacterium]|nr:hypothetical protein [Pirellulaceae bacterium]
MATVSEPLSVQHTPRLASWLPLLVLPATALILGADWPAWTLMWSLSFAIYAGFKWLTFADATIASPTNARSLAYLLLWPGMDADTFLDRSQAAQEPTLAERLHAVLKLTLGLALIILAKQMVSEHPLIGGWAGMAGVVFVLHFGLLHLLSTFWRDLGIQAVPIMNAPIMASSLS